jgi:acetyl esterase
MAPSDPVAEATWALLTPAMRRVVEIERRLETRLPPAEDGVAGMRRAYAHARRPWNRGGNRTSLTRECTVLGPHGPIPVRVYGPENAVPGTGLVWLHGGGFVVGGLDTHDRLQRVLAALSGAAVVAVDYRLAPEWRHPVQVEEAHAVLDWIAASGAGLGITRIALGGDSAGAALALATALGRRGRPLAPRALLLCYGLFGLRDSVSRRVWGSTLDGLRREDLDFYVEAWLGPGSAFDLLSEEMAGLPPALLAAVALDPLHDDSAALARLMERAGVTVRLDRHDGVLHGFLHYGRILPEARRALADGAAWVRRHLDAP